MKKYIGAAIGLIALLAIVGLVTAVIPNAEEIIEQTPEDECVCDGIPMEHQHQYRHGGEGSRGFGQGNGNGNYGNGPRDGSGHGSISRLNRNK